MNNLTNATAIGYNAKVSASNSLVLGNDANVGIGTSSPTEKLEVVGNTKTTNFQMTSGAAATYVLQSDANGNGTWVLPSSLGITGAVGPQGPAGNDGAMGPQGPAGNDGAMGATGLQGNDGFLSAGAAAGNTPYWDGSAWVLNSSNIFNNGGNVGVGTSTPAKMLDVNGDALINGVTVGKGAGNLSGNTVNGYEALLSITTGDSNTAVGYYALNANTTGGLNVANGYQALLQNTSGGYNTATGGNSLTLNTTGQLNTANGAQSLYLNTTGFYNTAVGANSLFNNTTGNYNTASGVDALYNNTTGVNNTAYGIKGLYTNTTGSNNTSIGYFADVTAGNLTNATAIGYDAKVDASNKVVVGNTAVTSIGGQVGWTTLSDRRLKTAIQKSELGLDFIMVLNPVTYEYTAEGQNGIRYTGLIAQEVDAAAKGTFSGVDKNGEYWGIRYAELTVPLVKAVQELEIENGELKMENEDLKKENDVQNIRIQKLEEMMAQYGSDLQACCFKSLDNKNAPVTTFEGASMEQNIPNPFSQTTYISFYLPEKVKNAVMQITDLNGKVLQTIVLKDRGVSAVTIDATDFSQGSYLYSLIVDGKTVTTKKMVTVGN